jgi:myo-inositol 2-dehydrogenase / D-chiro-inositol 1-dehydrogenase
VPADLRLAVIGAGRMGRTHLRVLADVPGAGVVAVVEPRPEARDDLGVDVYDDVTQLLAHADVDGAVVAASSNSHLEVVRELLRAGIPTLCEKPCGTSAAEAREAAELAATSGTPLQIGYWRRFVPELQALATRIGDGELGSIQLVLSSQWDERPPAAEFRGSSGGPVVDMGVHEFDQIRWLTGEELVRWSGVEASVGFDPPVAGDPESLELVAQLSGGGTAVVSLGRRFPPGDMCRVEIYGTAAFAESRFLWPPDSDAVFVASLAAQADAFLASLRGGPPCGATAEDAVAALAAAEAARAALGSVAVSA